jgi:methyltransferase family protein
MSETPQTKAEAVAPHLALFGMGDMLVARLVQAAAKLGLADHLESGQRSAEELAAPLHAHAPSLHRFMRTLAGLGILRQTEGRRFALTPLGEALRTNAPMSARPTLLLFDALQTSLEHFAYSLQTGAPGAEKAHGMPLFDYLQQRWRDADPIRRQRFGS